MEEVINTINKNMGDKLGYQSKRSSFVNRVIVSFLTVLCLLCTKIPAFISMNISFFSRYESYIIMVAFVALLFFGLIQRSLSLEKNKLWFLSYIVILLLTTLYNNGNLMKMIYEIIKMMQFFLMFSVLIKIEKNACFKTLYYSSLLLLVLNFIYWVAFPNGLFFRDNIYYFFDTTNETPNYVIPLIVIVLLFLYKERRHSGIRKFIIPGAIIISNIAMLLSIDCSTGKVAIVLLFAMIVFSKIIVKWITPKTLFVIYIAFLILIVFLRLQELFSFIIVDILGESLTLHTRTLAWDYAWQAFLQNPFFGKGYLTVDFKYSVICEFTNGRFSHSHCEFYEILLRSGAFGVLCLGGYYMSIIRKIEKSYRESRVIQLLVFSIFVFLIMSVNETCFTAYFFMLLALLENSKDIFERL